MCVVVVSHPAGAALRRTHGGVDRSGPCLERGAQLLFLPSQGGWCRIDVFFTRGRCSSTCRSSLRSSRSCKRCLPSSFSSRGLLDGVSFSHSLLHSVMLFSAETNSKRRQ
jgi:hypothetical protein